MSTVLKENIFPDEEWEWLWALYDQPTYAKALDFLAPDDIVLDIGAGDLHLAQLMAPHVRLVYAMELQVDITLRSTQHMPQNCQLILGDARHEPFPEDITTAVLLMRHCTHFELYWDKLTAVSCQKLITNARWGLDIESIDLRAKRLPYASLKMGWYACKCGSSGFLPGPAGKLNVEMMDTIQEVTNCPGCTRQHYNPLFTNKGLAKKQNHGWNRTRLP